MRGFLRCTIAAVVSLGSLPAVAECGPNDTVYIDPRLVPRRPHVTQEQVVNVLASEYLSEASKQQTLEAYRTQNDPIRMPMQNGYVLISPANPCIQQFVPVR